MIIILVTGIISFTLVSLLWIISTIIKRPIIGRMDSGGNRKKNDVLDEEQAAITTATWTILHPPS